MVRQPDEEYKINVAVCCSWCGDEIAFQYFNIDCDRTINIDASYCKKCRAEAVDDSYERGWAKGEIVGYNKGSQEAYDEGYEAGCESKIEFVPDDELAEDY
jgi:hypothetical protein